MPPGLTTPGELAHGRGGVVHVAPEVPDRERVEFAIRERQPLRLGTHDLHGPDQSLIARQLAARASQHLLALIDCDDAAAIAADDLRGHQACTGRDVDHTRGRLHVKRPDHRSAPATVLTEAQERAHPVVVRGKAGEELERVLLAR